MEFSEFGLSGQLLTALESLEIKLPTPVQQKALPLIMDGRNCIVTAQTGTGKTLAYLLPVLHRLIEHPQQASVAPQALILSPTRELAQQIYRTFLDLNTELNLRAACVYGGQNIDPQIAVINEGLNLLIATPGRLQDLLNNCALSLSQLAVLVLDEADMMLDMGFRKDIRKVVEMGPEGMQTLFFTATLPDMVSDMAYDLLKNPEEVHVNPNSATVKKIQQHLYYVAKPKKVELCLWLLRKEIKGTCIIFCRTKQGVDRLQATLVKNQLSAVGLHGDMSQKQRETALDQFKTGEAKYLVATDLASRGIDVEMLDNVMNYEMPHIPETYIHRIGRTGRAEQSGKAYSLCSPDEKNYVSSIQRMLHAPIQVETEHPFVDKIPEKKVKNVVKPKPEKKKANRSGTKRSSVGFKAGKNGFTKKKSATGGRRRRP